MGRPNVYQEGDDEGAIEASGGTRRCPSLRSLSASGTIEEAGRPSVIVYLKRTTYEETEAGHVALVLIELSSGDFALLRATESLRPFDDFHTRT